MTECCHIAQQRRLMAPRKLSARANFDTRVFQPLGTKKCPSSVKKCPKWDFYYIGTSEKMPDTQT